MSTDQIEALRRIIQERQESTQRERQVRVRANAYIVLGVLILSALGGVWLDRTRQWEGIKNYNDQTEVTDNATINEFVPIGSQDYTAIPDPFNTLQQLGLPEQKPNEKSPSTDTYGVQLATVFTEHDASIEKARLSRRYQNELENLSIFVESEKHKDFGTRYRIVAGKTDKESATETCRRLKEIGKECLLFKVAKVENWPP
jgi:hypothetical protein